MSDMPDLRMEAYWYGFAHTSNRQVDEILSAVACAGKAAHDTSCWGDEVPNHYGDHLEGLSPIAWIQNAAQRAADHIEREHVPKSESVHPVELSMAKTELEQAKAAINSLRSRFINTMLDIKVMLQDGDEDALVEYVSELTEGQDRIETDSVPRDLVNELIDAMQDEAMPLGYNKRTVKAIQSIREHGK